MKRRPFLTTERLDLWRPVASDLPGLHALTLDETMRLYLGQSDPDLGDSFARLHRNAGSWALHGYGSFMVRLAGTRKIIGNCGVFRTWRDIAGLDDVAEAGWVIDRAHWGQGIAVEAMRAALEWFDDAHGFQRVACVIEAGNAASEHLANTLGFVRYGADHDAHDGANLNLFERFPAV